MVSCCTYSHLGVYCSISVNLNIEIYEVSIIDRINNTITRLALKIIHKGVPCVPYLKIIQKGMSHVPYLKIVQK